MNTSCTFFSIVAVAIFGLSCNSGNSSISNIDSNNKANQTVVEEKVNTDSANAALKPNTLDSSLYSRLVNYLNENDSSEQWSKRRIYPKPGAILPFNRIVAFYGTPLSKRMGILGELPEDEMLEKLQAEVKRWTEADTTIPAIPALHYIATVAQDKPGRDGKYIARMPFSQIDTILRMAKKIDAVVFLDIQVALSKIETELPLLKKYLQMPNVHLGIDPEFSMKGGQRPGSIVGSYNSTDINYVINYLRDLVIANNLPPKILIVHRYTQPMVKNADAIKPLPEVQVVMDMDGWGKRNIKLYSYYNYIYKEPVQFTGFKVFYKNDTKRVNEATVMQPHEILQLVPKPIYIQYQ